jgi:hypothetical protein
MATQISYLDRLLEPMTDAFTPHLARTIVGLRVDSELEDHINDLRCKSNAGSLTEDEESEYKEFVEAIDVISVIQAKARRFLANYSA